MKLKFTLLLLLITQLLFAQNREHAFDVNQRLGRGINYGNMFEDNSAVVNVSSWKPQYASMIAKQGFSHIRVPIRWDTRTTNTEPYTISTAFLSKIKQVVDSALNNNLHVIINMHHHDSLFVNPDKYKARFLSQWTQISEYFKNYSDTLLFEIMNEPHDKLTAEKWNVFLVDALAEIRKTNPNRIVLIGTPDWGGLGGLPYLQLPADENIILTVHYYNPFQFTHQGASWVSGSTPWLGTTWNDSETEREVVANEFAPLVQFGKANNVPVHIGEFGAYSKADETSRKKWTTFIARYLESVGFSWAYWEFSAGFGIYNPSKSTWNQFLVDALLHNELPEPARYVGTPVYTSNFATTTDGWVLQKNSSTAALTRADNALKITIDNGGTEGWHVQLVKNGMNLTAGKQYRFSAKVKAETPRSATAYIGMNVSPWSAYSGYNGISLADTFKVYTFLFTMNTTDNAARIVFDLGKSTSDVTVTDVKLEEVVLQWPTAAVTTRNLKTTVYPNPANEVLYIDNRDEFTLVTIYNSSGIPVFERKINTATNEIDTGKLANGLYFVRLTGKDIQQVVKLLKQ
ncbi:MAG TPA: glycoside hydrolase [Prolixibacteraceae bacterium]|nr:glycoside hydrolase [Prolixibacteraceae bacterium]